MTAYPGFCLGVDLDKGRELYLIMKNGVKIIYVKTLGTLGLGLDSGHF